ncbi:MAG: GNAT family N-acetyltransferase [Gemmatimonadales bacterium]
MRAWLPERRLDGPLPAAEGDIDALNRLFADAFTDRYRRDGLVGVRVPPLNPRVWMYALRDAGAGAMLWRDEDGRLVAFNVAHRCGTEGWMGPLAVRVDRQGSGIGKAIVQTATEWLLDRGVATLGLETMPRTVENIGFYAHLGYVPGYLTLTMTRELAVRRRGGSTPALLSRLPPAAQNDAMAAVQTLVGSLAPGYDFTREIELTADLGLGDTSLVHGISGLDAMALWHSASLAAERTSDELRVLKLAARSIPAFEAALAAVEASATQAGLRRVAVRCQSRFEHAFRSLVARGYQVRWTDLRMHFEGYQERAVEHGVLFSNWEI